MIRGTTPTLEFGLPFDTVLIQNASIVLAQNGIVKIDKTLDDCAREGSKLILKLTQEDTLKLRGTIATEIQMRVKLYDGTALASKIIREDTFKILKDGVI